ncbi:hypothetical protein [Erythrobacter mangrovi]|uniref:Uncharacterized protein n=1 Tax=Erythrobacter mangrovi TaxID=2739433 RepID=A0A7D3XBI3_9SPHN|nr:hypothetical protein [Erythrobacter mangrovi]QKG71650.1 hypothetical protein HQR01_09900 [Erythrobacter mangrovi]
MSTLDRSTAPGHTRAPFRQFAGSRIIERQIDLALAAGCETIACLVEGIGREVIEAQRRAERGGARFIALQEPRPLSGLVTAADELFVLASGALPDEGAVLRYTARPAVLVFPAQDAVSKGYERIDAEFAWSGAMLTLGANVERLSELPPDADVISALLRIALQSGVRIQPLEKRLLEEGLWHLSPNEGALSEREARWITSHAAPAPFTAPGLAIAERMGTRLARDILGGRSARVPAIAAGLSGVLALSLGILGYPLASFGFGALMAMLGVAGETVERIAQAGQIGARRSALAKTIDWMLDPILAILIALASPEDTEWLRLFVPAVLFGLLRLAQHRGGGKWRESYRDRVALAILMVPAAFVGIVQPVTATLVLVVLLSLFRLPDRVE